MDTMLRKGLVLVLGLLFSLTASSQNISNPEIPKPGKYTIYGTFGIFPSEGWVAGTVNVERRLLLKEDKFINSLWTRVGAGYADNSFDNLLLLFGGITALAGQGTSHLELGLGLTYVNEFNSDDQYLGPMAAIGYRYQQPNGLILRAGIGLPETIYASIGFCF